MNQHTQTNTQHGYVLIAVTRVLLLLWLLALVVFFASRWRMRTDLTSDGLYTLTGSTQKVLASLKDRVLIEAYITPDDKLPEPVRDIRRMFKNCMDEYVQLGKGKVDVEYLDPQSDSTIKEKAERLGIKGQQLQESGSKAFSIVEIWQGMRIRYGGSKQKVIPFFGFSPATSYYEGLLTPPIKELSVDTKPKVGVLAFPTEAGGGGMGGMMGGRGGGQPQRFDKVREVAKGRYELTDIDLNDGKLVPDDVKTLLLIRPKNLNDRQKYALDQFVMRGGKLVVFCDTVEYQMGKERSLNSNPVNYDAPDSKLKFVDMLANWGVKTDDKLVSDAWPRMQEQFAVAGQLMGGGFGQLIPYPDRFHSVDKNWGDEDIVRLLSEDSPTPPDDAKLKAFRSFKPGIDTSNTFLKSFAKGLNGRGPGLFWPCRVELEERDGKPVLPDGVTGSVLMRSSPYSMAEAPPPSVSPLGSLYGNLRDRQNTLKRFFAEYSARIASENRQQFGLMVGLTGTFPSFFKGKAIPPRKKPEEPKKDTTDPLAEPIKSDPLKADSQPSSASQPSTSPVQGPPNPADQAAKDAAAAAAEAKKKEDEKDKDPAFLELAPKTAQVVVIGDSDLIRDDMVGEDYAQEGPTSYQIGARFFGGLLDWLSEDQDLIELTNKKATPRVLTYTSEASLKSGRDLEEISRAEDRKASRLRTAVILGPIALVLAAWALIALSRASAKKAFLASVGGR